MTRVWAVDRSRLAGAAETVLIDPELEEPEQRE
jgi:hypothetical protein